jgi:hypothetical protein
MSDCTHNLGERVTAVDFDGLCPICLQRERDKLRAALQEIAGAGVRGSSTCWGYCDAPGIAQAALATEEET